MTNRATHGANCLPNLGKQTSVTVRLVVRGTNEESHVANHAANTVSLIHRCAKMTDRG